MNDQIDTVICLQGLVDVAIRITRGDSAALHPGEATDTADQLQALLLAMRRELSSLVPA